MSDLLATCNCGNKMEVPGTAMGSKWDCNACGKKFAITLHNSVYITSPERAPENDDSEEELELEESPQSLVLVCCSSQKVYWFRV